MPSGVQLSRPIVPPGRQTRTSSSAAAWWCGANITPIEEMTTSNAPSSNGRCSASASTQLERDARALGAVPAGLEQLGREVARGHARAALRGGDRRVAGAGGDVEDVHAGADPAGLDEPRAEREQERLDHRWVVAGRPHRAVAGLQVRVGRWRLRAGVGRHLVPP